MSVMTYAHATTLRPARASRAIILTHDSDSLVKHGLATSWSIEGFMDFVADLPQDGVAIASLNFVHGNLDNFVNEDELVRALAGKVGTIVIHYDYNTSTGAAHTRIIRCSDLKSVVHILSWKFFHTTQIKDVAIGRILPWLKDVKRGPDKTWLVALDMILQFRPEDPSSWQLGDFLAPLTEDVNCLVETIAWARSLADLRQQKYRLRNVPNMIFIV